MLRTVILATVFLATLRAQMCTGRTISGPYGLQLSGNVTISGTEAPAAALATVNLSDDGKITGYSSVNFDGLLLGNPVTGTYELNPDCVLVLSLQDDSGAIQHFRGTVAAEGGRIEIRQTDPGTGERGILMRTGESCSEASLRREYSFTLSGTATKIATGGPPQPVSASGNLRLNADRKLVVTRPVAAPVTFEVQSDCVVKLEFPLSAGGDPVHLRGILANGGSAILAIQTDPGRPAAAV